MRNGNHLNGVMVMVRIKIGIILSDIIYPRIKVCLPT